MDIMISIRIYNSFATMESLPIELLLMIVGNHAPTYGAIRRLCRSLNAALRPWKGRMLRASIVECITAYDGYESPCGDSRYYKFRHNGLKHGREIVNVRRESFTTMRWRYGLQHGRTIKYSRDRRNKWYISSTENWCNGVQHGLEIWRRPSGIHYLIRYLNGFRIETYDFSWSKKHNLMVCDMNGDRRWQHACDHGTCYSDRCRLKFLTRHKKSNS